MNNTPVKLTIEEPTPGAFVWKLLQTDVEGSHPLVIRTAEDTSDSYEVALASGRRALDSEIRKRSEGTALNH